MHATSWLHDSLLLVLIYDHQVQENTITAVNPITENINDERYTNSNLMEEVTNFADYAAVETVDGDSSQITCEQTSMDDMSRLTELLPSNIIE